MSFLTMIPPSLYKLHSYLFSVPVSPLDADYVLPCISFLLCSLLVTPCSDKFIYLTAVDLQSGQT